MPTVLIISRDWKLRAALRAELLEAGVEALGMEFAEEAAGALPAGAWPSLLIVDSETAGSPGLRQIPRSVPRLVVASRTDAPPPPDAATVVMFRPVSIGEIAARALQLLQGCPA